MARARARRYERGTMNRLEARYVAEVLEAEKAAGVILNWWFEAVTLRLAKRTTYTPDFLVLHANHELGFREVKGFWQDDARVKIKVAAELFPLFEFTAVQRVKGAWKTERFDSGKDMTQADERMWGAEEALRRVLDQQATNCCEGCAAAERRIRELEDTLDRVRDWLNSFSVPPTSTIREKQEAIGWIDAALDARKETT